MNFKKDLMDKYQAKVSAAAELQYEKIDEAIKKDYNSRMEALNAWNGFGYCPVPLVLGYSVDLNTEELSVTTVCGVTKILKLGYVNHFYMSTKLCEKGWEKVNETTYRLS